MKMFKRIKTIIKANTNEVIERLEEPKKMLRQSIRDMEDQKYSMGKKTIELNAKLRGLKRNAEKATGNIKEAINANIEKIETVANSMMERYKTYDAKIEECKSKIAVLDARCTMVETLQEANDLLKELDIDLDTSTFSRMEEKIQTMEEKAYAEIDFYEKCEKPKGS